MQKHFISYDRSKLMGIIAGIIAASIFIAIMSRTVAQAMLWLALFIFVSVPGFQLDTKFMLVPVVLVALAIMLGKEKNREVNKTKESDTDTDK